MSDYSPHVIFLGGVALALWAWPDHEHHGIALGLAFGFMIGALARWVELREFEKKKRERLDAK